MTHPVDRPRRVRVGGERRGEEGGGEAQEGAPTLHAIT
jgi:hypothetical protein